MKNVLAVLLAGGVGERLHPLTRNRAKPAVPFGGMYRIIDITLSNCMNSECKRILVLVQYKSHSLARHMQFAWNSIFHAALLDAVVDGHEIENSKPDPEVFLLAAKNVGVPPAQCIVVEDAITGIEAARRAGMKALGIGPRERLPNADIVVPNLSAISIDQLLSQ